MCFIGFLQFSPQTTETRLGGYLVWRVCTIPPRPVYMLAVDIQKLVTSMLANTDTPAIAQRPAGKERESSGVSFKGIVLFLRQCVLKWVQMSRLHLAYPTPVTGWSTQAPITEFSLWARHCVRCLHSLVSLAVEGFVCVQKEIFHLGTRGQ